MEGGGGRVKTDCYSISHSFHVKKEISTGKKVGDVGACFSDISRPLLFHLAPSALLDNADVLSAKNFDSIPVFLSKKGMPHIHLKDKLLSLISFVSHRLFSLIMHI